MENEYPKSVLIARHIVNKVFFISVSFDYYLKR
jgi:hypothetical protein